MFDADTLDEYAAVAKLEDTTMAMADENQVNNDFLDESKRDTVRINLPQGGAGKPPATPTPTVRLKPAGAPSVAPAPADARKATAAISLPTAPAQPKKATAAITPVAPPQPKKDTSRVVAPIAAPTAAKPTVPEMPRPTVKHKREEPPVIATPVVESDASTPAATEAVATTSMLDVGLALAAMVVALAVAGYLFSLSRG